MKKVLFLMALAIPAALLVAVELPTANLTVVTQPQNTFTAKYPESWELANDEANPSGTWGLSPGKQGHKFAVKFTPRTYPFKITTAVYAPIQWMPPGDTVWTRPGAVVFFGTNLSGAPGTELGRKTAAAYELGNWDTFNVASLNITINSGSFFFAIERTSADPVGKGSYLATCMDFDKPVHHASWAFTTFSNPDSTWDGWLPFDEFGLQPPWPDTLAVGDSVDLMLRVRGTAPGIGEIELEPDVMGLSPSATILASNGTVSYYLPEAGEAEISLWDASGRLVKTLYSGNAASGEHSISWNASGLASGAYFMRLKTATDVKVTKIVLAD